MLYYLFRFLGEYGIPGSHIWTYISFRALLTLILSLVISVWFGEYFIKWMKRHNVSEAQRDKSIDPYGVEKKGVPTMGGIIIIVSIIVSSLVFPYINWQSVWVRVGVKLLLLVPVVGITYEFNRWVGRHVQDSKLAQFLTAPGLWMQNFTTNEPDDSMLEVAIEAMKLVIPEERGTDTW